MQEESDRHLRRHKLLYEAESNARQNATVAIKWSEIFEKKTHEELAEGIEQQRSACKQIISSKDEMIDEFGAELRMKEAEYGKSIEKHDEVVNLLLSCSSRQFGLLRTTLDEEIHGVEGALMHERKQRMQSQRQESDSLMEEQRHRQEGYFEARQLRVQETQRLLEAQRLSDAKDYQALKLRLEAEIERLEHELEAVRATYHLDGEKLEYDYKILVEREAENAATIQAQRKKLARMTDMLSSLKEQYAREERCYRAENHELTEEYIRIAAQVKELRNKTEHFERVDAKRYHDVWQLDRQTIGDLMRKILQADKIIHTQQLQLSWPPQSEHMLQSLGEGIRPASGEPARLARLAETAGARQGASISKGGLDDVKNKRVFELLCNEAGFLVEGQLLKRIESLPADEQRRLKLKSILEALGLDESAASVRKLFPYFRSSDEGLIHPNGVIKAVQAFVDDRDAERARGGLAMSFKLSGDDAGSQGTQRDDEREFWERVSEMMSDRKTYRVWNALEDALHKYHSLLKNRSGLVTEVSELQAENEELRSLLNQYLSSHNGTNQFLHVPPTQVIRRDCYPSLLPG